MFLFVQLPAQLLQALAVWVNLSAVHRRSAVLNQSHNQAQLHDAHGIGSVCACAATTVYFYEYWFSTGLA